MTDLLKKYHMISIGATCSCKRYIAENIKKDMYQIFDYVGTSMWSIVELLKNDFDGLLSKEHIKMMQIKSVKESMYTNEKYYVRFLHDLMGERHIDKAIEKNTRRINRFRELINGKESIIFFRIEEIQEGRKLYDMYEKYTKYPELYYVIEMSRWLKQNKTLKFRIIHFGTNQTKYDEDNNIIFINTDINNHGWDNCVKSMDAVMNDNRDVIEEGLKDF